jgi:hypothetical protein
MEVRCTGCNKLFRVSDDKIVGSGIKFPCTRCRETVKITREEFEQYKLAGEAALLLASVTPKPLKAPAEPPLPEPASFAPSPDLPAASVDSAVFDLSDPATAAASLSDQKNIEQEGEIAGLFDEPARPEPAAAAETDTQAATVQEEPSVSLPESAGADALQPTATAKPEPGAAIQIEARPEPVSTPVPQPRPSAAVAAPQSQKTEPKAPFPLKEEVKTTPKAASEAAISGMAPDTETSLSELLEKEANAPEPAVFDAAPQTPASGFRKTAPILAVVLLVGGAAVLGVISYLGKESGPATKTEVRITSPEGLQIVNPSAGFDSAKGDLVITGTVENSTEKPKPAWYVVVEVFDAQNTVIAKARLLSGKQLYSKRDLEILAKRGANIQDLKMKSLDQGMTIPPKGSSNFEIRILEAPAGVASFNPMLQPFDPMQLFKELAEEQK